MFITLALLVLLGAEVQLKDLILGNLFERDLKFRPGLWPKYALIKCCESHRTANGQTVCLLGDFDADIKGLPTIQNSLWSLKWP